MEKKHAIVSVALLATVVGAFAKRPIVAEVSGASAGAAQEGAVPAASHAVVQGEETDLNTVDVLGDSLGVDVTTDGLRRRAARIINQLSAPEFEERAWRSGLAFLTELLKLRIRGDAAGLTEVKAAARALENCQISEVAKPSESSVSMEPVYTLSSACRGDLSRVLAFVRAYMNQDALRVAEPGREEKLLAEDFALVDKTPLKLATLHRTADDRGMKVEFLIALLPDPVDSYTGWQFDPMLDAIAQAVSASDFVLDRFHLPDIDQANPSASAAEAAAAHRLHEIDPGVVIFRRHLATQKNDPAGKTPVEERLVLLLAHENPSSGVHARALAFAIRLVTRWHDLDRERPKGKRIRILGPTFSGSSDSIARALPLVAGPILSKDYRLRFISGSATDPLNQATIEHALYERECERGHPPDPERVTFQATVQPDDVLVPALVTQLNRVGWRAPLGVLFEGNTQYGREMWKTLSGNTELKTLSVANRPLLMQMPFPMNFSRLRTTMTAEASATTSVLGLPSRFRPLAMEENGNPVDKIPQMRPDTAATYAELGVAQMLETLGRERVRTVALLATDPRDKLFLAQQLARHAPGVSIATVESESLYIHPDYAPYLQGTLVVSTYSLYAGNQRWSDAAFESAERRRFANGAAQGIYNAALALLNYNVDGTPIDDGAPRLLEYGLPGDPCTRHCRPPVWVSVIGRGDAWPIRAEDIDPARRDEPGTGGVRSYVFPVSSGAPATASWSMAPPPLFVLLLLLLVGLAGGLWAHTAGWWRLVPQSEAPGPGVTRRARGSVAIYELTCVLSILVMALFVGAHVALWLRTESVVLRVVMIAVGAAVLAALVDAARRSAVRVARHTSWPMPLSSAGPLRLAIGTLAAVTIAWGLWALAAYLASRLADRSNAISVVTRAFELNNGVSPLTPVLLLCLGVVLWACVELRRRRGPRVALADPAVTPLLEAAIHGDASALQAPWRYAARGMLDVPRSLKVVTLLAVAGTCLFSFDPFVGPLVSIEGVWFGRFVSMAILAIQCLIVLALLQFVFLWLRLERLLGRIAWHDGVAAYERIPRDLYPSSLVSRAPRLMELQTLVAQWQRCVREAGWDSSRRASAPPRQRWVSAMFEREMRTLPEGAWSDSFTWKMIVRAASQATSALRAAQAEAAAAPAMWGGGAPAHKMGTSGARNVGVAVALEPEPARQPVLRGAFQAHEDLVAMAVTLLIRDALSRLEHNLVFVTLGVLLVFCSHTLFPFKAHQPLELIGWIYVGLTFAATLGVLARIKRNEIIGRLASPTPGKRATWDGELVLKLAVFGVLPLLTLFAAQFPDIGATILRWIEPVQKALP